uniref:Single-stranded DNA-binding protein (SSB) (Helix-destabilizing protein) n=1 Tax=mine drainage metagenome TaxID=410659 RepID=E6QMW7_9ZZZZ
MASVNKVTLLGNVGKDPEIRYAPSGSAICSVSIATTRKWKDKSGEKKEETDWHRVVFYERLAEIAGQYLKKGNPVYVEGRLKYGKYTDKDGVERYTTDIVVSEMQLLGGNPQEGGSRAPQSQQSRPSEQQRHQPSRPTTTQTQMGGGGFEDDDIPF